MNIKLHAALVLFLFPTLLPAQEPDFSPTTTVGGYGEAHYTNASGPRTPGQVNLARFVVYLAHQFSPQLSLRSELEVEDARIEGGEAGGEVALEQMVLEYRLSDDLALRTGLMLVPIGLLNEFHEPPAFNGVERPGFDHDVLPTTWRELGLGAAGRIPGLSGVSWRAYLLNGLKAEGLSGGEGIREGRQEGHEASFANPSVTGRLEYTRPGVRLGGAFWYGGTANQDSVLGTGLLDAPLVVLAADLKLDQGPWMLRGEAARISLSDAAAVNAAFGGDVGSRIEGFYLEGGYDLLAALAPRSTHRLVAFVRHERYDTHAGTPGGLARNGEYARRLTTMGLSWKPVWNVVLKGDYQLRRNRARVGEDQVVALGIGYQF